MKDYNKYRARAAKKPLQFWLQPFLLLLIIALLWRLLPFSALMYRARVVQPLPAPHVCYVKLDPAFATEVLRASMQAWRRTDFGSGSDALSFEAVEPFEPLGAPQLLEQGSVYPGRWSPDVVSPLAQNLPDLLRPSEFVSLYPDNVIASADLRVSLSPSLKTGGFKIPEIQPSTLTGVGSARFYVETDDSGQVAHLFLLDPEVKSALAIERLILRGAAEGAVRGELQVMWRKP